MEIMKALRMKRESEEFFSEKQKILNIVEQTWEEIRPLINEKYPNFEYHNVRVELNSRLRSTGGRAHLRSKKIELNERLLAKNLETVRMVFIHEMSHLIDYSVRGKSNHDYFFHNVMRSLGCEGTTYMPKGLNREMIPERKRQGRIAHHCEEGCVHMLTPHKTRNIARGMRYTCRKTGKELKLGNGPMPEPRNEIERKLLENLLNPKKSIIG